MDDECAFCGRGDRPVRPIYCHDCRAQHAVCTACADEVASQTELYSTVA